MAKGFDAIVEPLTAVPDALEGEDDGNDGLRMEAVEQATERLNEAVNTLFDALLDIEDRLNND